MAVELVSFEKLASEARKLEKKAPRKVTVSLPEFKLEEKDIVLLSPADITHLSYYDLLNEIDKVYKARAAAYLVEGRAPPPKSALLGMKKLSQVARAPGKPQLKGKPPVVSPSPIEKGRKKEEK